MSHLKIIIIITTAISITGLIFLSRSYTRLENSFPKRNNAIISMQNTALIGSLNGKKIWSIKAKSVEVSQDNSATIINDITDGIIYNINKPVISFNADKVILNNQTSNFEIKNRLDASSDNGYSFHCKNAYWSSKKNTLTSSSPVRFESENINISANKMQLDTKSKEMKLWNTKLLIKI